jgi:hypothetical protein
VHPVNEKANNRTMIFIRVQSIPICARCPVDSPGIRRDSFGLLALTKHREVTMPRITAKAKRQAIVEAYGCHRIEDDMDDFYYARRHLAKLDQADDRGWHELRYQDEEAELDDDIMRTLRTIRERDGEKYYREVAGNLKDQRAIGSHPRRN